jgi:hypothetical protein
MRSASGVMINSFITAINRVRSETVADIDRKNLQPLLRAASSDEIAATGGHPFFTSAGALSVFPAESYPSGSGL